MVEEIFLTKIREMSFKKDLLDLLIKIIEMNIQERNKEFYKTKETLEAENYKLDQKKRAYVDQLINGVIDDEFAKKLIDEANDKIRKNKMMISSMSDTGFNEKKVFDFCTNALTDLPKTWSRLDLSGKRRLQWFLFPEGLIFDGNKFGTAKTAYCFEVKRDFETKKYSLVEQRGVEPLTSSVRGMRSPN